MCYKQAFPSGTGIGLIVKGHHHIEHQLIEFISLLLSYPSRSSWSKMSFPLKVELAIACGLKEDMRSPLRHINKLRNNFAHDLSAEIEAKLILKIYSALSPRQIDVLKDSYKASGKGDLSKPLQDGARDLLIFLFLNLRQAIKAACYSIQTSRSSSV